MQTFKDVLEILYFLSAPVIVYLAYKALGQIKATKDQVIEAQKNRISNSKRETYTIAAKKCDEFLTIIIPIIDVLDKAKKKSGVSFFEKSQVTISKNKIEVKPNYSSKDEIIKVFNLPLLDLLNPLESFSLFFVSGVAEEKIGYLTIGKTFCSTVKDYLPAIVSLSEGEHFKNILSLFQIWNCRFEKVRLEKEKVRIEKELSNNKGFSIKAIGTE
ncbi:MAG: hypothetical protein KAS53_12015 [Candidatus Cloacimonetes bacterium]|nr:hypothetical protein [Candidatus Cloacimonadota bacterium]